MKPVFPARIASEEFSDGDRARFRERQHQMALARKRGERHLGA